MPRKSELTVTFTGPPGMGKSIIIEKFRAYLAFFDIETRIEGEHVLKVRHTAEALRRLAEAR